MDKMAPVLNWVRKSVRGTVIRRIWFQMILVTIYTILVVTIYTSIPLFRDKKLAINLTDVLGIVTGLLLVFRTQIAYDRYWEGRNLWTNLGSTVGTLARLIWISVKESNTQDLIEKKTIMNLLSAFPLATKHYLRDEYSQEFDDVKEYLTAFPETLAKPPPSRVKTIASMHPKGMQEQFPEFIAPSNAPGEITYYLGAYLDRITEREMADQNVMRILQDSVSALGDYLCRLEMILRTPMPLAYSVHLEHCLHIYILALPFQIVHDLMWFTVPIVVIACFAILGILGIGGEIENPFGYDDNDLALDDFCKDIINEIRLIISLKLPKQKEWMITGSNLPCGAGFGMSAEEILNTKTLEEAREIFRQQASINPSYLTKTASFKHKMANNNGIENSVKASTDIAISDDEP